MVSEKCTGRNLLNHLKQKNIPLELEQYQYKSKDIYNGYGHMYKIELEDVVLLMDLIKNKEEIRKEKHPYWVTNFTFNNEEYTSVGTSKMNSLESVLSLADSDIRSFLNQ
tara:strand:+ start:223 stop:552 length:330 start_codon:yes stop_codon:yes gene_type:complete